MRRWKILVTAPRAQSVLGRYIHELGQARCDVVARFPNERFKETELLTLVEDIDGIICGDDQITSRVMDQAPRLKAISKWGTGIDAIDLEAAGKHGITVCNSPDAFSDSVADTVFGYILLFTRQICKMNNDMHAGHWKRLPLRALFECSLGIIGLGNIGCAVAARGAAFGMRMMAYSINGPSDATIERLGVELVSLDTLLAQSDFITIHANLLKDNRHLINMKRLKQMKPTSVLINTARGALIDETALIAALSDGLIAGAALDVFEIEPLPASSPLRNFPNVYLAPHNANASILAADRVHTNSIRNLINALEAGCKP